MTNGNFLNNVLEKELLSIMATLLGLILTTSSFLLSNLNKIEMKLKNSFFEEPKKEIKHNLYFMLILFVITLIILIPHFEPNTQFYEYKKIGSISVLLLYLLAFFETIKAIFTIDQALTYIINKSKTK
jgi:uncharacterized membrane protein YphA (DoxX/SURF4 family)